MVSLADIKKNKKVSPEVSAMSASVKIQDGRIDSMSQVFRFNGDIGLEKGTGAFQQLGGTLNKAAVGIGTPAIAGKFLTKMMSDEMSGPG